MKKSYLKLRRLYEDQGLEREELCAMAHIPISTMSDRLGAPESAGTWRWKEITALCRVLHIPQEKIGEYFFPAVEKGESA